MILFSRYKTICKNTRTVYRKHVYREILSFFHLQRKLHLYKKRKSRKGKEFRRRDQIIKLVKTFEEI